jgi:starch-binding outer membrane protein, SusD/RagB family
MINKMKNKILYIMLIGFIFSCNVLDQEPISDVTGDNFFRNEGDVFAAISGSYDIFQRNTFGRDFFASASASSDESTTASSGGNNNRANAHGVNADHGPARDLWRGCYEGILRVNDIIENVPNIQDQALDLDNLRAEYMAEAKFIRGFLFYRLSIWYGEIPVILETTKSSDPDVVFVSRDPLVDVYTQIILDLEDAAADLPVSYGSNELTRIRATKGAAQALLAKVYLRRAYSDFAEPNDFQQAADYAKLVMDSDVYELVPNAEYASIWSVGQQLTTESIWELFTETVEVNRGDDLYREFERSENGARARARILPSPKLLDMLNQNPDDVRLTVIGDMDPEENFGFSKYTTKYNINGGIDMPNHIHLRLADIILVRALALNELGQTDDAIDLVNIIRDRAGIPDVSAATKEEAFNLIMDERFMELNFEGKRWYDLSMIPDNNYEFARTEFEDTGDARSQMDESETYQLRWPINNRELDLNFNLVQNPGYN